ncbi:MULTISPECIES: CvfB family protein [Anaerostipes]|uniref:RNA-binding protein n=1 Tax=Anaerostipes butyraticus TaxID=645466 RepID=A0A916Q6U2_9FIRM|nr:MULTISPECIES: S1-like domain-containing RNA-binding protein [Anaerostipes]GFO85407.1 RNA-binding protein [Anaerostipes butyraticus]HJC83205.1 RNA-binding protein [Candidatus Anaerostipes avicola]
MIELGKFQDLYIVKRKDFGVYVNDKKDADDGSILLPAKQVPKDARIGDRISCFVYKDSEDRPIATVHVPKITLGAIRPLRVKDVSSIGAFLDWGLEKDLFLPFKEQIGHIRPGREYLVSLYIDKSSRLCATMKIGKLLSTDHSYHAGDWVLGTIYNIHPDHGAFVAVEDQYLGRIPKQEIHEKLSVGDHLRMRITSVASDGKLNLSLHEKAYLQMDRDAKLVMDTIESYDGALPFNDKAKPAVIERELGLSKNAFKRAVGRLLKEGKITITPTGILKK